MEIEINPNISFLDEFKFQADVLIPIIKALRAELGDEHANQLVLGALRQWSREKFHQRGARIQGSPKDKWAALMNSSGPRIGNDTDFQWIKNDSEALECNITSCRYADFFRLIGEPELGAVLCCEGDFHVTEVGWPDVEFTRKQTIMDGAAYCDCRWRIKSSQVLK
jgi:hypothetical protein